MVRVNSFPVIYGGSDVNPYQLPHLVISHFSQCSRLVYTSHGKCYAVYGMVHIKDHLLLIEKRSS